MVQFHLAKKTTEAAMTGERTSRTHYLLTSVPLDNSLETPFCDLVSAYHKQELF